MFSHHYRRTHTTCPTKRETLLKGWKPNLSVVELNQSTDLSGHSPAYTHLTLPVLSGQRRTSLRPIDPVKELMLTPQYPWKKRF